MYESYQEIFQQKNSLTQTWDIMVANRDKLVDFIQAFDPGEILFVGCGSSYWLSMSACVTMQRETGIRCTAIKSGEIVMCPECFDRAYHRPLVICASRTGMTAETVIAAKKLKAWYDAPLLLITEYESCTLGDMADMVIRQPWAREASVMQTRSFCNLYFSLVMLSAFMSNNQVLLGDLRWYIDNYETLSADVDERVKWLGEKEFKGYDYVVTLGTGCQYGVTCEGAYIQQELANFRSGYFGTLEYRHGPRVTITPTTLFAIFSTGTQYELELKVMQELQASGAKVMVFSGHSSLEGADWNFSLGRETAQEVIALYGIMTLQGLAFYQALRGGVNPDNPTGEENHKQFIAKI